MFKKIKSSHLPIIILIIISPITVYGQIWDSLGIVVPGNIKYIEEHNGKLYISKPLGNANGVSLFGIGAWDGMAWDSVGGGIDGIVYGSEIFNNNLFFGGDFEYAGGPFPGGSTPKINNLTFWDGNQYYDIGFPSDGRINTLRVFQNELYIGLQNSLPIINGQSYSGIVKYDGNVFSDVGGGVFQNFREVIEMVEYNGDLIVAGRFDLAGTLPVNNIARWDGNQWHSMGDGLDYYVRSLCVDTINNILYAGGTFTHSGNILTPSIAKWDGSNWQPLDSSLTSTVSALTFYKGSLYAGVTTNFGQNPSSILKWSGSSWIPIIPYPDGVTNCLKVYQDWLYVAGGYMIDGIVYYTSRYKDTTTVGISENLEYYSNDISIYPNPTKDLIILTFEKSISANGIISICKNTGEVILRKKVKNIGTAIEINLPIEINNGIYVCRIEGDSFDFSKSFVLEK